MAVHAIQKAGRGPGRAGRAALSLLASFASLVAAAGCSKIPPGRSAIDSVRILHANEISAGDIEDKLATQASPKFLFLFQGVAYDYTVYDEGALQRDMARVERFYRANGFFDAQARVAHVFQVKPNHVRVEISVEEGPASYNRRVTVLGLEGLPASVASAVQAEARRAVKPGDRFDEKKFKDSEGVVKKALTDRGYAWATVDSEAEADIGSHVVDYGFKVDPGPPAVFGDVTIVGLDTGKNQGPLKQEIPEAPIRRTVAIRRGMPYSTADIDSATQALLDLQVFSSVSIEPQLTQPPPPDHVVPLTVKVQPTRLREITLGGGVEIDEIKTDLHLVAGWEDHNFLGGLRDFRASFKPGVVLYPVRINNFEGPIQPLLEEWFRTELRQPGFIEPRTAGFIRPQFNIFPLLVQVNPPKEQPVVGYREVKVPVGVDRTFFKKLYVSLGYTVQVENPFAYTQTLDPSLETIVLSFPELVAHLDLRDDPARPHEGIYLGGALSKAGGIFGGTADDVRFQPEVRTYLPIASGLTFATRASVGFLWAANYGADWEGQLRDSPETAVGPGPGVNGHTRQQLAHDTQVMYFRGFFSGGPTTNRGFPLLGVSPHGVIPFLNPANASQQVMFSCNPQMADFKPENCFLPVGGFTLWELQNEVRADISGPLSTTFFCDMSDVSPAVATFRFDHLHLSCGAGIAYDTPVGAIRADLGYRIPFLQVLGHSSEAEARAADPLEGTQPTIFGIPVALAIGIGRAY